MRTIIKFNKNTEVKEIEKVIEAVVAKYVVKHDRYSTEKNSQFEITKNDTEYYVEGKRINSHYIDLQLCYDELTDDDVYELIIDTHEIGEFEGYVENTEFYSLVSVKEDKAVVVDDVTFTKTKKNIKRAEQLFSNYDSESFIIADFFIRKENDKLNQLKETYRKIG